MVTILASGFFLAIRRFYCPALTNVLAVSRSHCQHEPAGDVLELLQHRHGAVGEDVLIGESEFDRDAHYAEKGQDDQAWHEEWDNFEHTLKAKARFFSRAAGEHLAAVFGGIDQLRKVCTNER